MAVEGDIAEERMAEEVADIGRRVEVRSPAVVVRMAVGKLQEVVYKVLVKMSQKAHLEELHTSLVEHRTTLFATIMSAETLEII